MCNKFLMNNVLRVHAPINMLEVDSIYVVCLKMNTSFLSAVGPPNQGRAQAPYSSLSFCLLGKK